MRKKSEECGKNIQAANRLYNNLKSLSLEEPIRSTNDNKFYEQIKERTEDVEEILKYIEQEEMIDIIKCENEYLEYNEKWHLIIGYYTYHAFDKGIDLEKEVKNWNLKGRTKLKDVLLLIWMLEAANLPKDYWKDIQECIDALENRECQHATTEDDDNLIKFFTKELWEKLSEKIIMEVN